MKKRFVALMSCVSMTILPILAASPALAAGATAQRAPAVRISRGTTGTAPMSGPIESGGAR